MATASKLRLLGAGLLVALLTSSASAQDCDPDLLMVLDRSGSMNETPAGDTNTKWESLNAAVLAITTQYVGKINFGMFTFPDDPHSSNQVCNPSAPACSVSGEECVASGTGTNCRSGSGTVFSPYYANDSKCPGTVPGRCYRTTPTGTTYRCRYYGRCETSYAAMCAASRPIPYNTGSGNEAPIVSYLNAEYPDERTPIYSALGAALTAARYDATVPTTSPPRFVLLMTDGQETCGASTAQSAARITTLRNRNIKTFVVGFGDGVDATALNALAQAGGTDAPGANYYYQADNATSLNQAMLDIAGQVYRSVLSGTSAATATAPILTATNEQWQMASAYQLEANQTGQWYGFLRATAKNPAGVVTKLLDLHTLLDARAYTDRTIYSVNSSGVLTPFSTVLSTDFASAYSSTSLTTSFLNQRITAGDACIAHAFFDSTAEFYKMFAGGTADNLTTAACTAAAAADELKSIQVFQEFKLADIIHSTPFVMTPPELVINEANHVAFRAAQKDRPLTAFVGTNDGAMHAFALTNDPSTTINDEGRELWAYVPRMIINKLPNGVRDHAELLDGPPIVRDVQLERTSSTSTNWRSVMLASLGRGGAGFFALDVTNPQSPSALWEISSATTGFANMGQAFGPAALGRVFITNKEVPVAFLQGGWEPTGGPTFAKGREFYIVHAFTGALIKKFDSTNVVGLDAPITGTPAVYDDLPGAMTTRAFVGDMKGRLWRIDTSNSNIAKWKMERFWPAVGSTYDTATYQRPVFLPPSLAFDFSRKLMAIYGTGASDLQDTATNYVWAIRETLTLPAVATDPPVATATQAWTTPLLLESTEKVVGDTVVFGGVVMFSTYLPTATSCSLGAGRLYALGMTDGAPKFKVSPTDPLEQVVAFVGTGTNKYQALGSGMPSAPLIRRQASTATADAAGNYTFTGGNYKALVQIGGSTKSETFNETTVAKDLGALPKRADILSMAEYE